MYKDIKMLYIKDNTRSFIMRKKTVSKILEKAKKKKGFTLIEVIAVIVIIAILAIITVPAISNYIGSSKDNTYLAYEKNMQTATNNMVVDCIANNDYTCNLPGDGDRSIVYLSDVIEKGYSDELKDPETDGFCNSLLSYVEVSKVSGDYEYRACLYCENYSTEGSACSKYESDNDNPVCGSVIGESTTWTKENRTISVGCSDQTSGCRLARFSKTFGTTTTESFINIVDKSGNQTSCPVKVYVDKTPPTCTLIRDGGNLEALGWYSGDVYVKFDTKDDADSGLLTYGLGTSIKNIDYNKKDSLKLDMGLTTVVGYVKDEAGNEGICSIDVRVGVPKPEFDVEYAYQLFPNQYEYTLSGLNLAGTILTTTTTNPVITFGTASYPTFNGIKKLTVTLNTNIPTTTTGRVYFKDQNGNELSVSALMIQGTRDIEFILPSVGQYSNFRLVLGALSGVSYNVSRIDLVAASPGIWTKNNVKVNLIPRAGLVRTTEYSFNDGASWQSTNYNIYSSNVTNAQVRTRNVVGLSSDPSSVTISRIDKTAPTASYSLLTGVYSANQTLTITVADNLSGIKEFQVKMERNGVAVGGITSITGQNKHVVSLPGGVYTVYTRLVDNAGNVITQSPNSGGWYHQTITADNEPPTCINSGGSATWKTTNVTITGTCNDADSGCVNSTVTKTYTSNINSTNESPGQVCDNAGNCTTCQADQIVRIDKNAPVISEAISGTPLFKDPTFASGTNNFSVYNNSGNGTVTHARVAQSNPYGSYVMRITTNGVSSPGLGGYVQTVTSRANAVYAHRIIAKIPVGYTIQRASNSTGTGSSVYWITPQAGTGDWAEYIYIQKAGSSGTFSTFGHVYLTGSGTSVSWDVAYSTIIDTGQDGLNGTIVFTGTDTNSGIIGYGINKSSTTQPTFTAISARTSFGIGVPNIASDNGTYYVWVKDQAGHVTNKAVVVDTIDTTKPTCVSSGGSSAWSKTTVNIIGTCSDSGSGCVNTTITKPYTSDINTTTAGPGEVCDRAGNCVTCPNNQTVKIDGTKPSKPTINLGSYTSGTWTSGNVVVTASSTDNISGISKYEYSNNGTSGWTTMSNPWTINFDTDKTYYVRSTDGAGNVSDNSNPFIVRRDATKPSKPTLTMKKADNSTYTSNTWSNQNIIITASSTDDNLAGYQYSTTGTSGWMAMTNPWTINWDTSTNIYVRAIDSSGNVSDVSNAVVIKRDATKPSKPTINLGSYTSGTWTSGNVVVTASSTDNISGISKYEYSVNGTSGWTNMANPWTISTDVESNYYVRSTDGAGNISDVSNVFNVKRDATKPSKPTLTLKKADGTTYTSNTWSNQNIVITASSSDTNLDRYEYSTNGTSGWTTMSNPWTISSDISTNVYVRAIDKSGNISDNSNVVTIKRDATKPSKPTINLGSYTSGTWTKSNVVITASSSDGTGSGIASYQYSHDAANWTAMSNPWTINWDGNWNFYVRSIDNAGNASAASNVFTIKRDTVNPTCTAVKTANGANGITVKVTTSDNASGVSPATYNDSNVKGTKTYTVTDGAGNTGTCSITSSCVTNKSCQHANCGWNSCLTGNPSVCVGGYNSCYTAGCGCTGNKRCTSYSCCGTYCKTKGNIYECYQNTGGYGCGTKCASSKPSSGGQTWYKTSTTCCVSGEEAATCYNDCCGCAGYYYCQHSACGWNNCLYTYSTCVGGNNSCRTAACGCENWG